jgi:hypothetical protein
MKKFFDPIKDAMAESAEELSRVMSQGEDSVSKVETDLFT